MEDLEMQVTQAEPPITPTRQAITCRRDYRELFTALKSKPNTWIAVDPADIGGNTTTEKLTRVLLCAKSRKMKVQQTLQNGVLYIRTIDTPVEVTNV
jgi:hypothetical protein